MTSTRDLSRYQDVLGQLPRLKTYTHILLGFALREDMPVADVIDLIESALQTLIDAFPWLAGCIVHQDVSPKSSGKFRLAICPEFGNSKNLVRIHDFTASMPSYQDILGARGPVHMFEGDTLGPVPAFPQVYDDAELNPAPVITLQLNLLNDGILLDMAVQHNIIDGGGLLRILELLAKAMRQEPFLPQELDEGNLDRRNVVRLLGPEEHMLDHSHLLRESFTSAPAATPRSAARWAIVRISESNKARLKDRANQDIQGSRGSFVSTNDALCAFIWQRLAHVRLQQGQKLSQRSKFSRALDARRALGLSRGYLGQMGFNASCYLTFEQLQKQSLGQVALFMRRAVEKVNNEYSVRSWATFVDREPDKSKIMFGGTFDPDTDIGVSSLVHASVSGVEFGLLGKPDLIRRPNFRPLEGCVYLWTETVEGDVDVLMCLRDVEWEGLTTDGEWAGYIEFIG